jgi:hypothetical protein
MNASGMRPMRNVEFGSIAANGRRPRVFAFDICPDTTSGKTIRPLPRHLRSELTEKRRRPKAMSSKEVEIWGKPLIKMTVKDLREIAKEIPEISGVHGMKKDELIDALREIKGIEDEGPKAKKTEGIGNLKQKIKALKVKRQEALAAKDKKLATIYRRKISRLKKKTRRAAA